MVNNYPLELAKWIRAIREGRPEPERIDARNDLNAWIEEHVRERDKATYRKYCIQKLMEVLDGE